MAAMMKLNDLKKYLNLIGSSLSVIGIIFVATNIAEYSNQIDASIFTLWLLLSLVGLVVFYSSINILLAIAWRDLLQYFGVSRNIPWSIKIYGMTQLSKYIPGNVFQLASRQAIGVAEGISNIPLAKSALWEILLLLFSGSLYIILILKLINVMLPSYAIMLIFLLAASLCYVTALFLFGRYISRALLYYIVLLGITGIIFVAVLMLVSSENNDIYTMIIPICGAYVVAWLVGLLTPGAPAGVGVRELVIFTLLGSSVNNADLLTAITLSRIVTVLSDMLFYALAVYWRRSFRTIL
jgi:glycosyltransferase 2 family protein